MKIARVIGTMVSSVKHETHRGYKFLFVQPVNGNGEDSEPAFIAVDGAQAGVGDHVLVVEEGKSARQVMLSPMAPCEAIVVGVVDHLTIGGRQVFLKPPSKESKRREDADPKVGKEGKPEAPKPRKKKPGQLA